MVPHFVDQYSPFAKSPIYNSNRRESSELVKKNLKKYKCALDHTNEVKLQVAQGLHCVLDM